MDNALKDVLWRQFGASIDMLLNVVAQCPEDYFLTKRRFFYIAYHATLFLDYYLTIPPAAFSPLLPFTPMDAAARPAEALGDLIPDRHYTKQELMNYLYRSREKCQWLLENLTLHERFTEGHEPGDMDYPVLEIILYNLRHTQHHTAQLNMLLRQEFDQHLEWSFRVGDLQEGG